MLKLVLEKAEEPEIKLPISAGSSKKQEFQKNIYFCFIDYAKAFDRVDHSKLGGILARKSIGCRDVQRKLQTELQTLEAETEVTLVVPIVQKITGSE